jgi:membrane protease YdiL (CAAX protease family)
MFSLAHFQFLLHPGIAGWLATGAIAGVGVINALWAQRTGSLRAPVATHATYNALMLAAFLVR